MLRFIYTCKKEQKITLYEVLEKDLKELPKSSLDVIKNMGIIRVVPTDLQLEKKAFEENNSLRSPRYIYNLLNKLGKKRCAMCGCEIPKIIQGAHILPVALIKKQEHITFEEKLKHATNGENGLWLCENHHTLFDQNIISISHFGNIVFSDSLSSESEKFLSNITTYRQLPEQIMTDQFVHYLDLRNKAGSCPLY